MDDTKRNNTDRKYVFIYYNSHSRCEPEYFPYIEHAHAHVSEHTQTNTGLGTRTTQHILHLHMATLTNYM